MTRRHKTRHIRRAVYFSVGIICGSLAMLLFAVNTVGNEAEQPGGYLPKNVPATPAATPFVTAAPDALLRSEAVTVNIGIGDPVGPETKVQGTAVSSDGLVYYRISDYRRGQVAAGEVKVTPGSRQPYSFTPQFTRIYTPGDSAMLDVYVLDGSGAEQLTQTPITLQ